MGFSFRSPTTFAGGHVNSSSQKVKWRIARNMAIWPNGMIFHQPGFPMSLTKPQLGVRSCEVAIIWPDLMSTLNWLRICCRKKIQVEILIDFRRHSEKYLSNSKLYYIAFGHHDVKIRSFFPFGRRESTHHEHARWNAFHRGHCNHCPRSHRYGCVFLDCLYCVKWYLQDAMSQNADRKVIQIVQPLRKLKVEISYDP